MKPFAWLPAALVGVVVIACSSSTPTRPPIETSAGKDPGVSAGGAGSPLPTSPDADGGSTTVATSEEGGVEGGVCTATNCGGCCDATNHCQNGTTNAACGISGGTCTSCATGLNCTNGSCF
jgi:hypothetical protein